MSEIKTPIIKTDELDLDRYSKDEEYQRVVDATLSRLAENLNMSFTELYTALCCKTMSLLVVWKTCTVKIM